MKELTESRPATEAAPGASPGVTTRVSVVVPVSERPARLEAVYREYSEPLRRAQVPFEFVFVVEPWFEELAAPLNRLADAGEAVRVLQVGQVAGEASLVKLGVGTASGDVIVTLPAYHRVEAACLPMLLERLDESTDLVVARRWPRRDSWVNRVQSRVFHWLIGRVAGAGIHDVASGVRVMRRELLDEIPLYGDFYRFLPLLAVREGYKVLEVPCSQHPQDSSARVYRPGVYLRRLIDVFGLYFLLRFTEKPLRFFGLLGSLLSLSGVILLAVIGTQRLLGQAIANRPLLLLGVLLLVLGVQAIALGLIGEIIVHLHAHRRLPYRLARQPERSQPGQRE